MRGALSTVWFDRSRICRDSPEQLASIEAMCTSLGALVQDEVSAGVPAHRIIVGMDSVETAAGGERRCCLTARNTALVTSCGKCSRVCVRERQPQPPHTYSSTSRQTIILWIMTHFTLNGGGRSWRDTLAAQMFLFVGPSVFCFYLKKRQVL